MTNNLYKVTKDENNGMGGFCVAQSDKGWKWEVFYWGTKADCLKVQKLFLKLNKKSGQLKP